MEREFLAVETGGGDGDKRWAADLATDLGEAQAAFLEGFQIASKVVEGRIDENQWFVGGGLWGVFEETRIIGWDIGDEEPPGKPDLGGGESDTLGLLHELDHPSGDLTELCGDGFDPLRFTFENRIGVIDYAQ